MLLNIQIRFACVQSRTGFSATLISVSRVSVLVIFMFNKEWGMKISHFSKGHCAGCSGGTEVGVVSCGWLTSTVVVVIIHNGLDR